jgi:Trypsin
MALIRALVAAVWCSRRSDSSANAPTNASPATISQPTHPPPRTGPNPATAGGVLGDPLQPDAGHHRALHRSRRDLDDRQRADHRPGRRVELPRQRLRRHPHQQPGGARPARRRAELRQLPGHHGAGRVPVGAQACKTGSTTGTTCGTVLAYNVTVNYAEGTVFGLTRTNICTQPGDSGGAMFAGSQAQGIVSGGTVVSCSSSSFRSFFQPADEPLSTYGLTLL